MINLKFHHNNVTYKICLKFLGLVIEIQIKVMLFPSKKMQVVSFTSYNTKHLLRIRKERNSSA